MRTLNLGILAHVDAGKTSLTERLLHAAGVIDAVGSVDDGSTQTDTLALERRRGITIKAAVVSFQLGDITVNLIDTPGHPDFIAEVSRSLAVLDGAVLVVSAVEGVQAQTRVLMRTLRRLRIPTLLFANKIDRSGASPSALLDGIARRLTPRIVAMNDVASPGTPVASVTPADFGAAATELLAETDDGVLASYVEDRAVAAADLRRGLAERTASATAHPLYFGSAITGAGVAELMDGIAEFLPASAGDPAGPVSGTVFKVDRGPAGEKIACARLFSGTIATRDKLPYGFDGVEGKVTGVEVYGPSDTATAGRIVRLWGLGEVRVGDPIGVPPASRGTRFFAPPSLETVVTSPDRARLHAALTLLAEQDPLIDLRMDGDDLSVSLYGEVQKEVIETTLAEEHGLRVEFHETTTIHVEKPVGTGEAFQRINTGPNPFLATIGLRVEPGEGVTFGLGVELGSMPYSFFKAVEETVHNALTQGLHGWRVTDIAVTMTHSGYWARQSHAHGTFDASMSSTAGDFRNLTPLVLMDALKQAGTHVLEPMHHLRLEAPADTLSALLPLLNRLGAVPESTDVRGDLAVLHGEIPAARVHELERRLPGMTRGEGLMESGFERHRRVRGATPERRRTDANPLSWKEYLLRVQRRV
ncbi:tetracycline resistance protein, tetM/tetO subfamily [Actinorhabdospora filicis]|uniref:Tetracycline resistance protein, tetM/tetO subfamily n=1 Tax=Actinorhabdospora filicis TaxID=1785913 RepID=A0A9W6SQY8_9ACTN|nr:TetM/TetW/TetO/TetS family tetracycline resistance ribosomal protection protein [Actinorhabdospora filicis]GLZ80252.1 tetracycline resistance protein, tetM/tetO subfamily [Actinorhabdospora filicis]